ncbi:MAG: hypothetical protein WD767_19040 [Alphaproteobacteria bacterium]
MWWKFALAMMSGAVLAVAILWTYKFLISDAVQDVRIGYVQSSWSSDNQDWDEFSKWLKHGGRKLLLNDAFSAAKDGLTEDQIRSFFGPPDLVVVGTDELEKKLPNANMRGLGAEGAYAYKLGEFAQPPSRDIFAEQLIIVFDRNGRVVYRLGQGTHVTGPETDVESDSRSDRRIGSAANRGG